METLDPALIGVIALTSGVGLAMVWLGSRLNALEQRPERRCPSCGRWVRPGGSCRCVD